MLTGKNYLILYFTVPSAAPMNLSATALSSREVVVMWTALPERERNGLIWYSVELRPSSSQGEYSTIITNATVVNIQRLDIFTEYEVRVRASTSVGDGPYTPIALVTTLEDGMSSYVIEELQVLLSIVLSSCIYSVPSAAPSDLVTTNHSSTTIDLMWGEVPERNRSGTIITYQLRFRQLSTDNNPWTFLMVPASNLTARLTELQEFVTYMIQISAATVAGLGQFSPVLNVTTLEDGEPICLGICNTFCTISVRHM